MKDLYSFQQKAWSHHSNIIVPLIVWKKLCIATAETDHSRRWIWESRGMFTIYLINRKKNASHLAIP